MKYFNTAGPVDPKRHYYVPHRFNEVLLQQLIDEQKYYILHAPRQSGKTTAINVLVDQLNSTNNYCALYINVEPAQTARSNVNNGLFTILNIIKARAHKAFPHNPALIFFDTITAAEISGNSLYECLEYLSSNLDKPLILFIDEIDSLIGDTLISVLRQLRAGYPNKPDDFPQSVCLIGVRDVRDYLIWSDKEQGMVLGGSAFNIKSESLILHSFSLEQVRDLYNQHTQDTGQQFTDEAIEYAFYLTQGQPWLVNALAYQACFRDIIDRSQTITKDIIERAKDTLILRRDTHIDQLVHKLKEPRVRRIIDAIIMGNDAPQDLPTDDIQYVIDLGLITKNNQRLAIANPIYKEVIPRELSYSTQLSITQQTSWYQNSDGSFNTHKMLEAFTQFYRENSEIWLEKFDYKESGPHLLLMAFLQRVINGLSFEALAKEDGGTIHREYALGRKRVDLLICWGTQRIVIELKIERGLQTIPEGLEQTAQYMDINNATEGHLIVFDRSLVKSWDEKIFRQEHKVGKDTVTVWGM
jgi:hypothetical protein